MLNFSQTLRILCYFCEISRMGFAFQYAMTVIISSHVNHKSTNNIITDIYVSQWKYSEKRSGFAAVGNFLTSLNRTLNNRQLLSCCLSITERTGNCVGLKNQVSANCRWIRCLITLHKCLWLIKALNRSDKSLFLIQLDVCHLNSKKKKKEKKIQIT